MQTSALAVALVAIAGCAESAKSDAPEAATPVVSAPAPVASASSVTAPDAVTAQHVLVAYKGASGASKTITRSHDEAKKRAEEVAARARAGEDFSALVAAYSDDLATKERQGNLGKFTRDKMLRAFSDAAFALPVGGISSPVETAFGFHVIKRNQ